MDILAMAQYSGFASRDDATMSFTTTAVPSFNRQRRPRRRGGHIGTPSKVLAPGLRRIHRRVTSSYSAWLRSDCSGHLAIATKPPLRR
jgi:hypothetical protein